MEQKRIVGAVKDAPKSREACRASSRILPSTLRLANNVERPARPKWSEMSRPANDRGPA